jgi:hypothetical protein
MLPPWDKQRVVETALEHPEKSLRELACYITDIGSIGICGMVRPDSVFRGSRLLFLPYSCSIILAYDCFDSQG